MQDYLDFEKPIADIEAKVEKLKTYAKGNPIVLEEIGKLKRKSAQLQQEIFGKLTAWQRTQVARHPNRPNTMDYINHISQDFIELHGDRCFGDDHSIVAGLGWFGQRSVMFIGHQKGRTTKEKVYRNFGMPNPEGYRKALRLMKFAEKFQKPVITFIDTPGAYPGIGAEERGQSEAIARNLVVMSSLGVPIISVVIGEGGSGGALALGVADRILMLEHSVYSVISPEGCAAILWNNGAKAPDAAEAMKMTARDLERLGVINGIIPEPLGGAHRDVAKTVEAVQKAIIEQLTKLEGLTTDDLLAQRYEKYRRMGMWGEDRPAGQP
jgi:acetyl-CoA carboxylase carboxyl transferase subunit alpha